MSFGSNGAQAHEVENTEFERPLKRNQFKFLILNSIKHNRIKFSVKSKE